MKNHSFLLELSLTAKEMNTEPLVAIKNDSFLLECILQDGLSTMGVKFHCKLRQVERCAKECARVTL